jgi:hypothetical protein
MKRQERRGAYGDGDLSDASWAEEKRPHSADQPVAPGRVRRSLASTAQDDHCCLSRRFSAITARASPGPHSFAVVTARWSKVIRIPSCARQRRSDIRRHATLPQTWIQHENWQFETDRRRIVAPEGIMHTLSPSRVQERRTGAGARRHGQTEVSSSATRGVHIQPSHFPSLQRGRDADQHP